MFTYINENFLHAPSVDLSRDTVKALIHITLAQGQEVFLERQVRDGKKPGLLAKLASQAAFLYSQAKEGLEAESSKGIFDSSWLKLVIVKTAYMASLAEYNQALADDDTNLHGSAIARLQLADKSSKLAYTSAKAFPSSPATASNLGSDAATTLQTVTKRQIELVQEKIMTLIKDNDFIYHQAVPAEASLSPVTKLPAAKAIPVSELYQGQDIQRIIGPDIFQKIVPMSVTESASMYDEEKAQMIRQEADKVEQANGEMAASLDYLKLPNSLNILKGGSEQEISVDPEFERWCRDLAGHESFSGAFDQLQKEKSEVLESLGRSSKQLDMEQSVCEKMRSKYGGEWTQQPSSRLTSTLRSDIRSYQDTVTEASGSDTQLLNTSRQFESDFEEMQSAGQNGEADVLYQQALIKASSGLSKGKSKTTEGSLLDEDYSDAGPSVIEQIAKVEELLKKLNLLKRERVQVLKDLKEKVHSDDISNVLILNKKAIGNQEKQLFQAELEKFRSHQNRLLSTVHKQSSMLKELTKVYGDLLQDKRVRTEQQRYEVVSKNKATVMTKYKRAYNAYEDLTQGLVRAQGFYGEIKENVDSLEKNVDSFVNNRRAEGASLLNQIEQKNAASSGGQAAAERERLQQLMERMSMEPSSADSQFKQRSPTTQQQPFFPSKPAASIPARTSYMNADPRFTIPPREEPAPVNIDALGGYSQPQQSYASPPQPQPQTQIHRTPSNAQDGFSQGAAIPLGAPYNPMAYPERSGSTVQHQSNNMYSSAHSPQHTAAPYYASQPQNPLARAPSNPSQPPSAGLTSPYQVLNFTSPPPTHMPTFPAQHSRTYSQSQQSIPTTSPSLGQVPFQGYHIPQNYVPPPPPPGPPGGGSTTMYPPNSGQWGLGSGPPQMQRPGSVGQNAPPNQQDPWAGLSAWK